jgi:hypothetical protein
MPGYDACKSSSNYGRDKELCDSVILGQIWRRSGSATLGTLPDKATSYCKSATELMQALTKMFTDIRCLQYHDSCSPAKKFSEFKTATKQDKRWKDVLRPHHKERMAAQRKKMGL